METFLITLLVAYFFLKCVMLIKQLQAAEKNWEKLDKCDIDVSTKSGARLKVHKISDEEYTFELTTKEGKVIKYPTE